MNVLKGQHSGLELLVGPVGGSARCVRLLLLAALMLGWSGLVVANDCHVTPTGTGDGSSWNSPTHLQDALDDPACSNLWLAAGTYRRYDGYRFSGGNPGKLIGGGWVKLRDFPALWVRQNDPSLTVLSSAIIRPLSSTWPMPESNSPAMCGRPSMATCNAGGWSTDSCACAATPVAPSICWRSAASGADSAPVAVRGAWPMARPGWSTKSCLSGRFVSGY